MTQRRQLPQRQDEEAREDGHRGDRYRGAEDRDGTFDPVMVAKGQRRLPGLDEKVIAPYARGTATREIQGHLKELYGVEVSPALI